MILEWLKMNWGVPMKLNPLDWLILPLLKIRSLQVEIQSLLIEVTWRKLFLEYSFTYTGYTIYLLIKFPKRVQTHQNVWKKLHAGILHWCLQKWWTCDNFFSLTIKFFCVFIWAVQQNCNKILIKLSSFGTRMVDKNLFISVSGLNDVYTCWKILCCECLIYQSCQNQHCC